MPVYSIPGVLDLVKSEKKKENNEGRKYVGRNQSKNLEVQKVTTINTVKI